MSVSRKINTYLYLYINCILFYRFVTSAKASVKHTSLVDLIESIKSRKQIKRMFDGLKHSNVDTNE